jgi:dethiobiotin synthetase
MARKPPGLFIAGSDTGVGKTYVAALIAQALCQRGHSVGVYKPVATGCHSRATGSASVSRNTGKSRGTRKFSLDAQQLWEAAGRPGPLSRVCPQVFAAPLAPHLAAAEEGKEVDSDLLRTGVEYWRKRSDILLVEGAGGLMSPLTDDEYNADLAYDLGYPLLIVVPNRIGAINQALQTLIAAATFKDGLRVAGIVLNHVSDDLMDDPSITTNGRELRRCSVPPVLAEVGFGQERIDCDLDWLSIAQSE